MDLRDELMSREVGPQSLECGLGEYATLSTEALQAFQDLCPEQSGEELLMSRFLRDAKKLMEAGQVDVGQYHGNPCPIDVFPHVPVPLNRVTSQTTLRSEFSFSESSPIEEPAQRSSIKTDEDFLASALLKSRTRAIHYNIILVGGSGLGKTSFIRAFLDLKINRLTGKKTNPRVSLLQPTMEIEHNRAVYSVAGLDLHFDLIDTPGYDACDSFSHWETTVETFIRESAVNYAKEKETKARSERTDSRIHMCLYFLEGVRVRETDLKAMYALQDCVNIIPIVSKGDAYTSAEMLQAKLHVIEVCSHAGIRLFDCVDAAPKKAQELNEAVLGPCPPFALLSHCDPVRGSHGKATYGREYQWGFCDIKNPAHSDFSLLSKLLVAYFMIPSIEKTKDLAKQILRDLEEKKERKREENSKNRKMAAVISVVSAVTLGLVSFMRK